MIIESFALQVLGQKIHNRPKISVDLQWRMGKLASQVLDSDTL